VRRHPFFVITIGVVILCQKFNGLPELLVRSVQFRMRDFELVVSIGQERELFFKIAGVFLLALTECALGSSVLGASSLLAQLAIILMRANQALTHTGRDSCPLS
jgi:hypothetical protein